jgi:hypothetical protein
VPNPPKPIEQKRRTGNPGKRALPSESSMLVLPMADGVPDPPAELGLEGRGLWGRAWGHGLTWISPTSDMDAVVEACRVADDLAVARNRFHATTDPADGRAVVAMSKRLSEALSALGFTPTDRSRLGVAEVKRQNALETLIGRRQA